MMYTDISREDNQSPPGFFYYQKTDRQKGGAQMADSKDRADDIPVEVTSRADDPDRSTEQSSDKVVSVNGEKADGEGESSKTVGNGNLQPFSRSNVEKARECGRIGGKKSGESKRQKKAAKEILETLLTAQMDSEQVEDVLGTAESLLGHENSVYAVMLAKMIQEGCAGNVQAAAFVRDTAGDKPTDRQEVTAAVTAGDVALLEKVGARLGIKKADELTE